MKIRKGKDSENLDKANAQSRYQSWEKSAY